MRQGRSVRTGVLFSIGLVVLLAGGQGIAIGAEGSTSLDEPVDTITDTIDDPVDTITDTVDDPVDTITDTVDDSTDAVTDTVDDATDPVDDATDPVDDATDPVDDTTGTVTDVVDGTVGATGGSTGDALGSISGASPGSETSGGALDAAANTAAGAEVASSPVWATALPGPAGSPGTSAFVAGSDDPSDLDDLAAGGNDVVDGSARPVCVGTADIVCLELVGGGELSVLFRAAEETRKAVSAFVDKLVRTGADLVGEITLLVALMITGIVLTSRRRRPNTVPAGSEGPLART